MSSTAMAARLQSRFGRRRRFTSANLLTALLGLVVLVLFVWPVAMIVIGGFRTKPNGGNWTLEGYQHAYTDHVTYEALLNSVIFTIAVTVIGMTVAIVAAWMVARTNIPGRRLITPMMLLLLAVPSLIYAISWDLVGTRNGGLLNHLLSTFFGVNSSPINIETWPGVILVSAMKAAPFAYFLIVGAFSRLDRSQEEASYLAGASRLQTFLRIDLSVLAPALLGTTILTIVLGLEAFDVPLILGTPAHIQVLSTQIYGFINNFTPSRYAEAAAVSQLLVMVVVLLVWLRSRFLGKREFTTVGRGYVPAEWDLGRKRWIGTAVIAIFAAVVVILPMVQLVIGSLQPIFGIYGTYTTANYHAVFNDPDAGSAIVATILFAVVGGLIAMLLACVIAYMNRYRKDLGSRFISTATWLPWAVPGVVLGLGILWAYLSVPGVSKLYGTDWILMVGLITVAIPAASRAAEGAIAQLPRDLGEAARVSGSRPSGALARIVVPLISPSFMAGWLLTGILIAGNLSVVILLSSPSTGTISTVAYGYYVGGNTAQAAALFCIMLAGLMVATAGLILLRFVLAFVVPSVRSRRQGRPPTATQAES
jgi:iron(III) transport system permease protein